MNVETIQTLLLAFFGVVVAGFNATGAWFAWQSVKSGRETKAVAIEAKDVAIEALVKIEKVDMHTNSMKDALVKLTGETAFAAGEKKATKAGEEKAATLAEGIAQGTETATQAAEAKAAKLAEGIAQGVGLQESPARTESPSKP